MTALTPTGFASFDTARDYGKYASAVAVRADAVYSKTSEIVIHTLEGDKGTLSTSTCNAGSYETYEALAVGKGTSAFKYNEAAYFESRKEIKNINEILGTLDDMMEDLLAGNLEDALYRRSGFTGLDSIAAFSADLNVTATLTASRFETASTPTSVPGTGDGENDAIRRIDQATDKISSALNTRTALPKNLLPKMDDFFSDWFDKASYKPNHQAEGMRWASRSARRLVDGLKPRMPHEGQGRKG